MLFEEKDLTFVAEILKEELSVSENVVNATKIIAQQIVDDIPNAVEKGDYWNVKFVKRDGLIIKDADFIGSVTINYVCYYPNDDVQLSKILNGLKLGGVAKLEGTYVENEKLYGFEIDLPFIFYHNEYQSEWFDTTLFHEIEHGFQKYKELSNGIESHTSELYDLAIENLNNYNPYIALASNIIYNTYKPEQDAFASQLYQYLINQKGAMIDINTVLQNTETGKIYQNYKTFEEELNYYPDDAPYYIKACEFFNKPNLNDYLERLVKYGKKRYLTKIGKVYAKYRKDKSGVKERFEIDKDNNRVRIKLYEYTDNEGVKQIGRYFTYPYYPHDMIIDRKKYKIL